MRRCSKRIALGIAAEGRKHALGLWDGSTENATLCQELLSNLQSRGLRTDRSLLVILDGSKALRKAVRATFGEAALVQRCQVHKLRNVLEHLSERQRAWVRVIMRRAYRSDRVATAQRLLQDLGRRLDDVSPSAAESLREGLDETLTVLGLGLSDRLRRSLATTNAAESLISRTRHVKRNVTRWRGGKMVVRWVAAGVLEAVKGFRRLKGTPTCPRWSQRCARGIVNSDSLCRRRRSRRSRSRQPSRRRNSTGDGTTPERASAPPLQLAVAMRRSRIGVFFSVRLTRGFSRAGC